MAGGQGKIPGVSVEICVDNLESVIACAEGGAERIELCACLSEGGITPSVGFLRAARRVFPGKIMVMIRPRAGDFLYSEGEFELMLDEIEMLRREGADGVVFGMLLPDGRIDAERCRVAMERAAGLDVTFHRAFDVSRDLEESLEVLISLGVPRVLTSGGEPDVVRGAERLVALVKQAAGRIVVLPGGGVRPEMIADLVKLSGVGEVHLSVRVAVESGMAHRATGVSFSPPGGDDFVRKVASATLIREAREAMRRTAPEKSGLWSSLMRKAKQLTRREVAAEGPGAV
jgi:copper homeostasis protein